MHIWLYWDNVSGEKTPPTYIQLCWQTIHKHCGNDFNIHLVTSENVQQFLPNISDKFFQIAQVNNKSNYLRYTLLKEHGGIWLDSDLILFRSLKPILDLLQGKIDLIATASPTLRYGEPESGFLVSTKDGKTISKAVVLIEHALDLHPPGHIFKWGSLGPGIIRQAVKDHQYHHLNYQLLMPIPSWEAFRFGGKDSINKYCNNDSYGCMLFHEMFKQYNHPILQMNHQQLLETPILLGQMFRKAMEN